MSDQIVFNNLIPNIFSHITPTGTHPSVGYDYDPNPPHIAEVQALLDSTLPNKTDQETLLRAFAECLKDVPKKELVVLLGTGGNGKSTLLSPLMYALGPNLKIVPFNSVIDTPHKCVILAEAESDAVIKSISTRTIMTCNKLPEIDPNIDTIIINFPVTFGSSSIPPELYCDFGYHDRMQRWQSSFMHILLNKIEN